MSRLPSFDVEDHLFLRLKDDEGAEVGERQFQRALMLRETLFSHQLDYHLDDHPRKTLLCPRRSGKTWAIVVDLVIECLTKPYAKVAYITLARNQGKRNIWQLLQELNTKYDLGIKFHHTELTAYFPQSSSLMIGGAQTEADIARYRGLALDKAAIDEAASFDADLLRELINDILAPCLYDRFGKLTLAGTPGPVLAGPFWEATGDPAFDQHQSSDGTVYATSRPYRHRRHPRWNGVDFIWSHHSWTMAENEAMPHLWQEAQRIHKLSGGDDQDPTWLRENLGKWVSDDSAFVYRYNSRKNSWVPEPSIKTRFGLPEGHQWHLLMGVDLGYDDDFDIEIAAWSPTCREFYHVDGFAAPGMTISQMADAIKEMDKKYNCDVIVGDTLGLGKAIFEEMRNKFGINVIPAKHTDKRDFIELLNSELLSGRCKIRKGSTLEKQMRTLQWENPKTKKREHPKMPNHACDAFLYLVRYAYHYYSRPIDPKPERGTEDWWKMKEQEELQKVCEEEELRISGKRIPVGMAHNLYQQRILEQKLNRIRRVLLN